MGDGPPYAVDCSISTRWSTLPGGRGRFPTYDLACLGLLVLVPKGVSKGAKPDDRVDETLSGGVIAAPRLPSRGQCF